MKRQARYKKGDRIGGRYLVHQALLGGMGEVYLCLDEEQNYPYALKTFQGSDLRMKALFEGEVASWIALEKHPNIVRLFHTHTLDDIPFMVLEWVASNESRGTDLRSWLQDGALELDLALKFTVDIVRGLQHASEKSPGIVHRDLKPDNVLVNQSRQAKITDFGLATVVQGANLDIQTGATGEVSMGQSMRVGNIVGTPAYMPPEQWRGELDLDFRTDIYAVGCIFYEMLTGKMLYKGRTISELKSQHMEAPLPALNEDFPPELKQVLEGCLAKEPDNRFARLDLLLVDLIKIYETESGEIIPEIETESMTVSDYGNRGITYNDLGQHQRAIQDFDQAVRLDPTLKEIYYNRGLAYGDLGQHQRAIQDFDQAIHLDPNYESAYNNRGIRYRALGQPERAIIDYNEAIRLDPTNAKTYYNRGISYDNLGQSERAIRDYDEAIRLDPKLAAAYDNRGKSYGVLGQYQRSIEDFDEAIRLDPTDAKAYYNRGKSYGNLGHHEQAIQDFDEAIRLDSTLVIAYSNRGETYDNLGHHKRAMQDFDEAIRLDPTFAPAYDSRGTSFGEQGQYGRAMQDFDEAIRLDPTNAKAYYNRGKCYGSLGQHQRAIQDYDQAIQLDPNYVLAYLNRGNRYNDLGQYRRAIQNFDEAIRLDSTFAPAYLNKAISLTLLGQLEEAMDWGVKAAELGAPRAREFVNQVQQMLGQASAQSAENEQEVALRQMVEIYQQHGEASVRQMLHGSISAEQIEQLIIQIKQIIQNTKPTENEQEAALRQMVEIYQKHGEASLRQILQQNNFPAAQIEEIIVVIKQIIEGA